MTKNKGWHGEPRRHGLARKGVKTVIDDEHRLAVNNFVARGHVINGYNIDNIYNNFIEAMLWSTIDENFDDETFLDYNYTIHDVDKETEMKIKLLIEYFINENHELIDEVEINTNIRISEEMIGHDLYLDTQGHGVGFWDRGYGYNGVLLSKEAKKIFNSNMEAYAGNDGKIYIDGMSNTKLSGNIQNYKSFDISTIDGIKEAEKYKSMLENSFDNVETKNIGIDKVKIIGKDK